MAASIAGKQRQNEAIKSEEARDGGVGNAISDIALPANVNTITVWLRHSGENSTGVGLDRLRVEDLSM